MHSISHVPTVADPSGPHSALDAVAQEAWEVAEPCLIPINLSIPDAISTALASCRRLRELHERGSAVICDEIERVGRIELYALALGQVDARLAACTLRVPQGDAATLRASYRWLRRSMRALYKAHGARTWALLERKPSTRLEQIAYEVLTICDVVRNGWLALLSEDSVVREKVSLAERTASRVVAALGKEWASADEVALATELKKRVFFLFVWTYKSIRLGVRARSESREEADLLVPCLYRRKRRPGHAGPPTPDDEMAPTERTPMTLRCG